MAFDLENLVRENVKRLVPYSSARGEFGGGAQVFLNANENSFGSPIAANYSRYPDPLQLKIKKKLAEINRLRPSEIFVGNGSDEAIDLLFRIFCRPQIDEVIICPPTYGMYEVAASVNDVRVRRVNLTDKFELNADGVRNAISETTKIIFLCSPNNPSGNSLSSEVILTLAELFRGIVVVDEAYIHFSDEKSLSSEIENYPNLVVLQTFSKAWGLAGLRVGLAFANPEIIKLFNKIKPPYNVSQIAQELILTAFAKRSEVEDAISEIVGERQRLGDNLGQFPFVLKVYASDANFLLVKTVDAGDIYRFLLEKKIVVRDRSDLELCEGCLRITVGTKNENRTLIEALKKYEKGFIH